MLAFTVKKGDCFWVGEVRVIVKEVRLSKVTLAFDSPPDIEIDRDAIRQAKIADREKAHDSTRR